MSNQYFNFYYSPARQGFDSSTWRALYGAPIGSGGNLLLSDTAMIHYGDILRGDAAFGLNLAAPGTGLSKRFGFYQPGRNSYAWFNITGTVIKVECSNGSNTTSTLLTWQSAWTSTDTEFRVQWEAGAVSFYVGGVKQLVISDSSVTGDPMSIYIANDSDDTIILKYIDVKSIQSFLMGTANEDALFAQNYVYVASGIATTEAVTMLMKILDVNSLTGVSDSVSISENVTVTLYWPISVVDSINVTESKTVSAPA